MKVLIGCEFSGTVRDAFRRRGHDAWSCDLLQSNSEYHYACDVLKVLRLGWDIAIFHPPCTYLTISAEWAYTDGPYHQKVKPETLTGEARREAVKFVKQLLDSNVRRIALENPIGCLSRLIRKPEQIIQPYNFGEDASKSTCLWLKDLPILRATKFIPPMMVCKCGQTYGHERAEKLGCPSCGGEPGLAKPRWANQTNSGQNKLSPSDDRWAARSLTYQGIANAMAEQWG